MEKIKIHFYKGTSFFARIIQWRTFSKFSHVSIQLGRTIYEAREFVGVRAVKARKAPRSLFETISYKITNENYNTLQKFLSEQVGKPYDYLGVLLFLGFTRKYGITKKWFCSNFIDYTLKICSIKKKSKYLVSPGELYLLLK